MTQRFHVLRPGQYFQDHQNHGILWDIWDSKEDNTIAMCAFESSAQDLCRILNDWHNALPPVATHLLDTQESKR